MVPDRRDPRPTPLGLPGAQGLYPSDTLARILQRGSLPEPEHATNPAQGLGAHPSLKLLIDDTPELGP